MRSSVVRLCCPLAVIGRTTVVIAAVLVKRSTGLVVSMLMRLSLDVSLDFGANDSASVLEARAEERRQGTKL